LTIDGKKDSKTSPNKRARHAEDFSAAFPSAPREYHGGSPRSLVATSAVRPGSSRRATLTTTAQITTPRASAIMITPTLRREAPLNIRLPSPYYEEATAQRALAPAHEQPYGRPVDEQRQHGGEVAFAAELDEEFGFDEGLFSGSGTKSGVTTHYLTSTSQFDGSDARPSINNSGDVAFVESIDFARGIFVGQEGEFTQIVAADPTVGLGVPILNDAGTVVFQRSFFDEPTQQFVEEIVMIDADGTSTVVADTRGGFSSFGFSPPPSTTPATWPSSPPSTTLRPPESSSAPTP
jgi:hypothetical protein